MAYLILSDFKKQIQSTNLQQIIGSDQSILTSAILTAVAESISYLVQRFITSQEFQDLNVWNPAAIYKPTNRVYLDALPYAQQVYALGDLSLQAGNIYQCSVVIAAPEVFNPAHWALLGPEFTIYNVPYPNPLFQLQGFYNVGDIVFWKDRSYTCSIATVGDTHNADLQAVYTNQIPFNNQFPDAIGQTQWQATGPIPYVVPANTLILNTTYWARGDNRNQQLLTYTIDIALYHVHCRIAPQNIPDIRVKRYDDAKKWLKMAAVGDVTADLPMIQPKSGNRIRYGSLVRTRTTF